MALVFKSRSASVREQTEAKAARKSAIKFFKLTLWWAFLFVLDQRLSMTLFLTV
jgi:hypothetical protein